MDYKFFIPLWVLFLLPASSACTHQQIRVSQTNDTQLSCLALRNELTQVEEVRADIDSKTGFSGRNVGLALVFLPGIFINEAQASSAAAAAVARTNRLNQLYYERRCLEKEQRR